jgi:hypothetical protein
MEYLISTVEFCNHYNIESSFINSLQEFGLIEITVQEENAFVDVNQFYELEQFIHLHYDLDINLEGIEAIKHLLQRIRKMQDEVTALKNRLRLYEGNE